MRQRPFLLLLGLAFFAAASAGASVTGCGQTIVVPPRGSGSGGRDASTATSGGAGGGQVPSDAAPDYVDPGCPDAGPPGTDFTCDAFNQHNGDCPAGQGCYIFTQNPQTPCGQEVYGSTCLPEGMGQQSAPCGGDQGCAAGLTCVVSGSGNQCVVLCELEGASSCPAGFVCEPIDVQGFGGCL